MKLVFITGNKGKIQEASAIIPDLEQKDIDLVEIQSLDSKDIIKEKLEEAKKQVNGNLIVEDGSLEIASLNGLPGPLIKWFMKTLDNEGIYKIVRDLPDRSAIAKVTIGASFEDGNVEFFEGIIEGEIVEPRGENGFGWDKIFKPSQLNKTFAEMTQEEKNRISMRKIAFEKLKDYLNH